MRYALVVVRVALVVTGSLWSECARVGALRRTLMSLRVAHAVRSRCVVVAERETVVREESRSAQREHSGAARYEVRSTSIPRRIG